jgi:hypothetical protein
MRPPCCRETGDDPDWLRTRNKTKRRLYKVFYVERFVKVDARIRGFACPKMASGSGMDGYDDLTIATFVCRGSLLK